MSEIRFMIGRFNPPTPGHLKMIIAASEGKWDDKEIFENPYEHTTSPIQQPPLIIFPTYTEDSTKNPLDFKTKVKHLEKIIYYHFKKEAQLIDLSKHSLYSLNNLDHGTIYINNTDKSNNRGIWGNPYRIVCEMKKTKYNSVRLICGEDRLKLFEGFGSSIFRNSYKQSKFKSSNNNSSGIRSSISNNSSNSSARFNVHGLLRDALAISATKIRENTKKKNNWEHLYDYVQIFLPSENINELYTEVSLALGIEHSKNTTNNRLQILNELKNVIDQKLNEEFKKEYDPTNIESNCGNTSCECPNTEVNKLKRKHNAVGSKMKNIKEQAKKLKIRLTYERNGKRYKKTEKMLLRQINAKLKKNKK